VLGGGTLYSPTLRSTEAATPAKGAFNCRASNIGPRQVELGLRRSHIGRLRAGRKPRELRAGLLKLRLCRPKIIRCQAAACGVQLSLRLAQLGLGYSHFLWRRSAEQIPIVRLREVGLRLSDGGALESHIQPGE
jgi:hypothetical protein